MVYIIIDSSHQLLYTGIISGTYSNIDSLYDDFEKIFHENGVAYKYHWRKLSRKTKNKLKKPTIYASVAGKNSKWVGLADVYLGIYISEKDLFDGLKNVYSVKVK